MAVNDRFLHIFHQSNLSVYRLSKQSGVPYTCVYELVHGKKDINQRPAEMLKRLAAALDCTMEQLLNPTHFMVGVSGKMLGVSYVWEYDDRMVLCIKDGNSTTGIKTNLEMTNMNQRRIYDGVAEAYIRYYSKLKEIHAHEERIADAYRVSTVA